MKDKETKHEDTKPEEPKRPTSGWQGAFYNIAEQLEQLAGGQSNQDDRLHTLRFAKILKDEAVK
jgi:hypothetical protein